MQLQRVQNLAPPPIFLGLSGAAPTPPADGAFLAHNAAAMNKMMAAMDVKPTGDVDADCTATMIPHHQGAIDMAQADLRYGYNEILRRIAQGRTTSMCSMPPRCLAVIRVLAIRA